MRTAIRNWILKTGTPLVALAVSGAWAAAPAANDVFGGAVTNLTISGVAPTTNGVGLTFSFPPDTYADGLDVFYRADLVTSGWTLRATNISTAGGSPTAWTDTNATDAIGFYRVGCAGDADGDGIPNAQEVLLYGTDPFNWDTDGDGVSDYDEIFVYGTDPTGTHNSLLPYYSGFETGEEYLAGPLHGQSGWVCSDAVAVQGATARTGSQAITLEGTGASATKHFASTHSVLTAKMFVYLGPQFSVPDNLPASASSLISFESETGLRAFNGNGSGGGSWTTAPDTADLLNRWVELKIEQDYSAKTWRLHVDGNLKLSGLGFKDAGIAQPGALHIRSGIGGAVSCDDIDVW